MRKRNIVYIIGAGASKDFGLPLGLEIYNFAYKIAALKNKPLHKELKPAIREVEKNLKRLFINLPKDKVAYPPFEEVLTFIWDSKKTVDYDYYAETKKLNRIFDTARDAHQTLSYYIKALRITLLGCMQYFLPDTDINSYNKYIKNLDFRKNNISFISLNYDLVLDNILNDCVAENIINDYTYGIPLADATIKLSYPNRDKKEIRDKGIYLLKPHGSINLYYCDHHKQATYGEGYFCACDNDSMINDRLPCPSCNFPMKPLIIPPLYNKKTFIEDTKPKTERLIWRSTPDDYRMHIDRRVREVLSKADEIVIIGYSMPGYDYDFKGLLITGLMMNNRRQHLHAKIINKGDDIQAAALCAQYKYLVGKVTVEGNDGFYKYLTQQAGRVGR